MNSKLNNSKSAKPTTQNSKLKNAPTAHNSKFKTRNSKFFLFFSMKSFLKTLPILKSSKKRQFVEGFTFRLFSAFYIAGEFI